MQRVLLALGDSFVGGPDHSSGGRALQGLRTDLHLRRPLPVDRRSRFVVLQLFRKVNINKSVRYRIIELPNQVSGLKHANRRVDGQRENKDLNV